MKEDNPMKENLDCLRCGSQMRFNRRENLQLGEYGFLTGHWSNLLSGSLAVDIYCCPDCGKLEFFRTEDSDHDLPQRTCPVCGKQHDFDYPKCPFCKHDYSAEEDAKKPEPPDLPGGW